MDSTLNLRGTDPTALTTLSSALERALAMHGAHEREVVFACIGTDRSTGDALGPLVGQRLRRLGCTAENVIGTLEEPLHALNLAERLGPLAEADPRPLVVAVMFSASVAFATPVGYQTNMMVYGPGGYRFSDFMRVGIPLNILTGLLASALIPVIWPL